MKLGLLSEIVVPLGFLISADSAIRGSGMLIGKVSNSVSVWSLNT